MTFYPFAPRYKRIVSERKQNVSLIKRNRIRVGASPSWVATNPNPEVLAQESERNPDTPGRQA